MPRKAVVASRVAHLIGHQVEILLAAPYHERPAVVGECISLLPLGLAYFFRVRTIEGIDRMISTAAIATVTDLGGPPLASS